MCSNNNDNIIYNNIIYDNIIHNHLDGEGFGGGEEAGEGRRVRRRDDERVQAQPHLIICDTTRASIRYFAYYNITIT